MRKIVSLFQRNYDGDRLVRDEVTPGAEWVVAGEGTATQKFDGTCCMVDEHGNLWKRYEVKQGKTAPEGFLPANDVDENTGKQQGWMPVRAVSEDRWHLEAFVEMGLPPGTYELIGPKVQSNPEGSEVHLLLPHGRELLPDAPRDFDGIRSYLATHDIEGIVWHHPDGRMVKIKAKDFGLKRGAALSQVTT